jgi:hypothetical protein
LLSPTPLSSMQFSRLDEPPVFFFPLSFFIVQVSLPVMNIRSC